MSCTPEFTCETRLCDDCKGLRFADKASGGFISQKSNNKAPTLSFHKEQARDRQRGSLKLLMIQERNDSSPDFPTLADSAAQGCGFCGFVRAAILREKIQAMETQKTVRVGLFYAWDPREWLTTQWDLGEGLHMFFVEIYTDHRTQAAHEIFGILQFKVYSKDSTSFYESGPWFTQVCRN